MAKTMTPVETSTDSPPLYQKCRIAPPVDPPRIRRPRPSDAPTGPHTVGSSQSEGAKKWANPTAPIGINKAITRKPNQENGQRGLDQLSVHPRETRAGWPVGEESG